NIEKARVANEVQIGLGSAPKAPDESRIGAEPADQQSEPGSQATNLRLVLDAFPDKGMDLLEIHAGSQDALTQNAITRFAGVVGAPEKNAHSMAQIMRSRRLSWRRQLSAASSSGNTLNRSPTRPISAISKIAESASLLIATMVPASLMPVRCWIAPLIPIAI